MSKDLSTGKNTQPKYNQINLNKLNLNNEIFSIKRNYPELVFLASF